MRTLRLDHRRLPAASVFLSTFLLLSQSTAVPLSAAALGKPNILLITIDTLRADHLGCYGYAGVRTPAIDALAGRGVLFTRAFAHTPATLPSHTNILLGLTPNAHGVHDNSNFIVRENFLTLAEWLKGQGYATGAFVGAFPLDSRFGLTKGFDIYDDRYGSQGPSDLTFVERRADTVVDKALAWLAESRGPWFLWVHCFDPHQPYDPPEPFKSRYRERPYDGEIAFVDSALARLIGFLKDRRAEGGTAVIFTADHGESLGEHGEMTHGYFAYNATLRVPLILVLPGMKPGRVEVEACHIDIFPTVCDLLGQTPPSGLQGMSLLPLLRGKSLPARPIYFEALTAYYNRGWAPLRGYIQGREKYMESPIPEVYDLDKDFGELENIASRSDLERCRKTFAAVVQAESSPLAASAGQRMDRQTTEKLRSLGYLASPQSPARKTFTAKDDLKTLLPFHAKWAAATAAYAAGRTADGIALLKEIITERKDFDLAYTYLANFYKERKRPRDAEAVLLEALQNNPESFRIMMAYGITLIEEGRFGPAVDVLKKSLALIDFDPETWNYLGVAYWNMGRFEDAQDAYTQALRLAPDDAMVFNNFGSLYLSRFDKLEQSDDLAKAKEYFRKAIELDPKYASAYNGLGAALRQSGDLNGAVEAWKKVVALKPDFGFALYNLGRTLLAGGDKSQAFVYLTRYKDLFYPDLSPQEKARLDELIRSCR
jgi:arylsulfatase A-like enzyme/Flp pilus assembly protein TadD